MRRSDLWEASTDERERLAGERESIADERDRLADERDRLSDEHDRALDFLAQRYLASEPDEAAERMATQAALDHAEAAVQRAEAELLRARQAADRVVARIGLRTAARERALATQRAEQAIDAEEFAWLQDRRDFVAAEREDLAAKRDLLADERDEAANLRERMADKSENQSLERERRIDRLRPIGRPTTTRRLAASERPPPPSELRDSRENQRGAATAKRHVAMRDRAAAASEWGPTTYGPMLVASFADLAGKLFAFEDLSDVLARVLKFTVAAVAGCESASVSLWRNARTVQTTATDAVAAELDDLQFGTEIGPALEALRSDHPIYARRLSDAPEWPVLAATAGQLGVSSALCHGLFIHRSAQWSALGTFTLYGATPDAFGDEDQEFGSILAAYLSVAVATAQRRYDLDRREAALHRGLATRDVIGQAKGILMERQRLSAGDAFDLLRRASQRLNRKVADVAQQLAETGELPTSPDLAISPAEGNRPATP